MPTAPKRQPVTIEEALARPEHECVELIRGTLLPKAAPTYEHGTTQLSVGSILKPQFSRKPGGRWPGGWWIASEVDIVLGPDLFRPDIAGWRRERSVEGLHDRPVRLRPDWICEVLSASDEQRDRVDKMKAYFRAGVPHYWLADPAERVLEVYRHTELSYALVLSAKAGETIRAEPFDAVELRVDELFGADPED